MVELLSDNSPLLIVNNEKLERKRDINEKALRGQFTNLKETLSSNLKTNRGLTAILVRDYRGLGLKSDRLWKMISAIILLLMSIWISVRRMVLLSAKINYS